MKKDAKRASFCFWKHEAVKEKFYQPCFVHMLMADDKRGGMRKGRPFQLIF
ncbi:hypothetical protein BJQ97_01507 [Geobacillus sp. TFV-3]|nr:hypothetical protein BJQ97_01507 [Geobacillus sp. TFV-3]